MTKIVYVAPNRSHHYPYAEALARHSLLKAFVAGFPRFGPHAQTHELGSLLKRRDEVQLLYLLSLRVPGLRGGVAEWLAYASKCYLDRSALSWAADSDLLLAYNGCALHSFTVLAGTRTKRVLEVVNSHVLYQEELLSDEYESLGLKYRGIHGREKERRIQEYGVCDYVLCPSSFVARSLIANGVPANKILKNGYGFRRIPVYRDAFTNKTGLRILYVGSVSVRKGLQYLIAAIKLIGGHAVSLDIVGPMTDVSGLEKMTMPRSVRMHGSVKSYALGAMFAQSDIFVLPSIEEGQALVIGEALAFGLPVVATENTGADDIIEDGKEGFIVPIRDARALAHKITLLIENPELRLRMGSAALEKSKSLGGWDVAGDRLVSVLKSVLIK